MLVARAKSFEEFMAVIEIPNAYTSDMAISTPGSERFVMVGTPIIAVDLIDTVAAPGSPAAEDLLSADRDAEAWWRIEGTRAPRRRHSGHPRMHRLRAIWGKRSRHGPLDDLCGRQPPAFMVRACRLRQPGTSRPALPPRRPCLTVA